MLTDRSNMDVLDEVIASLPTEHQHYVRWCADECDPVNPYHDAWEPDGIDHYSTDFPTRTIGIRWGITQLAVMCDATYAGFVKADRVLHNEREKLRAIRTIAANNHIGGMSIPMSKRLIAIIDGNP